MFLLSHSHINQVLFLSCRVKNKKTKKEKKKTSVLTVFLTMSLAVSGARGGEEFLASSSHSNLPRRPCTQYHKVEDQHGSMVAMEWQL